MANTPKDKAAAAAAVKQATQEARKDASAKLGFDEKAVPTSTVKNPPVKSQKDIDADAAKAAKAELAAKKAEQKAEFDKMKAAAKVEADKEKAIKGEVKAKEAAEKAAKKAEAKAARDTKLAELGKAGPMAALALGVKEGRYVKGTTGQLRSTDEVAVALDGVAAVDVVKLGLDLLKLETNPYANLNPGQQSMNLRNKLRGAIKAEVVTIADIAAYIERNKIHRITAESVAAEKAAKAQKKAEALAEAERKKVAKAAATEKAESAAATGETA